MRHVQFARGLAAALLLFVASCASVLDEAPPLENGVYVARGVCFGEGGCNRYWRAYEPVEIHERADPASTVIATVAPDEWVEAIDGQLRFVPLRGVVHTATETPPLAVGDVVYMLEPEGEGFYVLWHNGETPEHDWASGDPNEPITWDAEAAAPGGAVLGWWVQLKLENGQTGWVNDPRFECMGSLQGSEGCRE